MPSTAPRGRREACRQRTSRSRGACGRHGLAEKGVDGDFHRGERAVELHVFGGPVGDEPERKNPLMYPISLSGPYYACLLAGGTLDTKGGPKVTPNMQVVDDLDRPIPGLYGVGNCVAGATTRAYWACGSRLGPMIGFAHGAAKTVHAEPAGSLKPTTVRPAPRVARGPAPGAPALLPEGPDSTGEAMGAVRIDNARDIRSEGARALAPPRQ